jgi:hypothetical protein
MVHASSTSLSIIATCVNGEIVEINGVALNAQSVTWDWGDGSTSTGLFPVGHVYTGSGSYTITGTEVGLDGVTVTTTTSASVGPNALSGCLSISISAGSGGSISYQATTPLTSVGSSGTVSPAQSPLIYYLAYGTGIDLSAIPSPAFTFSSWTLGSGINIAPISPCQNIACASISVSVYSNSAVSASFSAASGSPNLIVVGVSVGTLDIGIPSTITINVMNIGTATSQARRTVVILDFYNDPNGPWSGIYESLLRGKVLIEEDANLPVYLPAIAPGETVPVQVIVTPSLYDFPSFVFTNFLQGSLLGVGPLGTPIDPQSQVLLNHVALSCGLSIAEMLVLAEFIKPFLNYFPKGSASPSGALANFVQFVSDGKINVSPNSAADILDLLGKVLAATYEASQNTEFWKTLIVTLWALTGGGFINTVFSCAQTLLGGVDLTSWVVSLLLNFIYGLAQQGYISLKDGLNYLESIIGNTKSTSVILTEPSTQHDLNLVVATQQGEVGLLSNGTVLNSIPGGYYLKIPPEVQVVVLNQTVPIQVSVDATNAQQLHEVFNITIVYSNGNNQTYLQTQTGSIVQGTTTTFAIVPSSQGFDLAGISVATFLTDLNLNPLSTDNAGDPMVSVLFHDGQIIGTSPLLVVAMTNVTNTGNTPLNSIKLNQTIPADWTVPLSALPPSLLSFVCDFVRILCPVHVFFVYSNGTRQDITDGSMFTVSLSSPQTVTLSITNMTATRAHRPIGPGESILVSIRIWYQLLGTNQSATSYPRTYMTSTSVSGWMQTYFTAGQTGSTSIASFVAYTKIISHRGFEVE